MQERTRTGRKGRFPCGMCQKAVGRNSVICAACNGFVSRLKVADDFKCSKRLSASKTGSVTEEKYVVL
jgi:hypothetical protein